MIIYRVENKEGFGPYTTGSSWSLIDEYEHDLDEYLINHPGGYAEFTFMLSWEELQKYSFGFESFSSLKKWFKKDFLTLKKRDFCISTYETEDFFAGKTQAIFNKENSKLVSRENI